MEQVFRGSWDETVKQLGKEGFISFTVPYASSSSEAVRVETLLEQELEAEWCRGHGGAAHRLACAGLPSLLSYRAWDQQPGMAPPTMGWALPYGSLTRKMSGGLPTA